MKFKLGDKVISKTTGYPASGEVVSISNGMFYLLTNQNSSHKRWFNLYEQWPMKPVYTIKLKSPQRPTTMEEYLEASGQEEVTPWLKFQYEASGASALIAYPEDDIELFDSE